MLLKTAQNLAVFSVTYPTSDTVFPNVNKLVAGKVRHKIQNCSGFHFSGIFTRAFTFL